MSTMFDTTIQSATQMSRGTYLNIFQGSQDTCDVTSEVIRDALAARSNTQLYNKLGISTSNSAMEIAYRLYNDWDNDNDGVIRSRRGVPHTYHPVVGRWVPVMEKFGDVADLSYWLTKNATNSSKAREDYYSGWKEMPRGARIKNPYSYFPPDEALRDTDGVSGGAGCSIRIGNFNNTMNEADLVLILSTYGPIIDVYRPTHKKRDTYMSKDRMEKCKKAFYLFVEFASAETAAAVVADINKIGGSVYFMNYPITIDLAGARPGVPAF